MDWSGIITGLAGVYNMYSGAKKDKNIAKMYDSSWQMIANVTPPSLQNLTVSLAQEVQQGTLTPEQAVSKLQEASAMAGVQVPQELIDAQYNALNQIREVAEQGGLTAIDRQRLNQIANEEAQRERGAREALTQNFQARGIAGSGTEQAMQMLNQQASATRASGRDVDVAAEAQRRALEAMSKQGALSSSMRTQEFGEQAAKAQADDAIARFNASMRQQTELANVSARNRAQEGNLSLAQSVEQRNVAAANKTQELNQAAVAKDYATRLAQANAAAAAARGSAAGLEGVAGREQTRVANAIGEIDKRKDTINTGIDDVFGFGKPAPVSNSTIIDELTQKKYYTAQDLANLQL